MYLVSAYFDDKTNRILQGYIDRIARQTGNTFMLDNNVPPHMTISQIEARNADVLIPAFERLEGQQLKAGQIQIASVGQLMPYVIYAAPVLNRYLQGLSETVYAAFSGVKDTSISRYYRPFSWMPHITLGKKLDKEQMRQAFEVMQGAFNVCEGSIVRLGLSEVNPHRDLKVMELR